MKNERVDVVVIGNIVRETIFLSDKIVGPVLGSPCAYTSLALSKAGKRTGIVTYCGEEMQDVIERELRIVDITGCIPYLHTTENHLIYQGGGRNRVEYFKTAPMINYDVLPENYLEADVFFICPMDFEVNVEIGERLKAAGKKVLVDLGGYGGTTSYNHFSIQTNRGKKLVDDLCKDAFVIKASEDDLGYIMPGMTVEECLEYFVARGAEYAVATMGERGAAYRSRSGETAFQDSFSLIEDQEKNPVGAGDVFSAGLIIAMEKDPGDISAAVKYANSMASLCMEEKGGCAESRMPVDRMVRLRMEGRL